ncbi:hypothetical protein EPN96_03440 [bacterium]|nr:MAG: hypothetical protein EPN96_03440 [bacterium]
MGERVIACNEVLEVRTEIPEGHKHIRTTVTLASGETLVFQEATIAAIVRAYATVKTHPLEKSVVLKGRVLSERKEGYAEWQLVEEEK